jgi:acyl carrier protein
MIDRAQVSAVVLEHVRTACAHHAEPIEMETELIASGALDSLRILDLIEFVERRFDLQLSEEDLSPLNFDSVAKVTDLVVARSKGE